MEHKQNSYSLPGIIHYLQSEFTRNEKDRIDFEARIGEMNAKIAHLEGQVKNLTEENHKLRGQLNSKNNHKQHDNAKYNGKIKPLDLNPLKEARDRLQKRLEEVSYVLRPVTNTKLISNSAEFSNNISPLGKSIALTNNNDMFNTTSNSYPSPEPEAESGMTIDGSMAPPSSVDEISEGLAEQSLNKNIEFDPSTHEIPVPGESDNEDVQTIVGENDNEVMNSQEEKFKKESNDLLNSLAQRNDKNLFEFAAHENVINSISVNDVTNKILSASSDLVIKIWSIKKNSKTFELNLLKKLQGEPNNILKLQWLSNRNNKSSDSSLFWTQTASSVKIWDANQSIFKHNIEIENIIHVESLNDRLLIATSDQYYIYDDIKLEKGKVRLTANMPNKVNIKFIAFAHSSIVYIGDKIYVRTGNSKVEFPKLPQGVAVDDIKQLVGLPNGQFIISTIDTLFIYQKINIVDTIRDSNIIEIKVSKGHLLILNELGEISVYQTDQKTGLIKDSLKKVGVDLSNLTPFSQDFSNVFDLLSESELLVGDQSGKITLYNF